MHRARTLRHARCAPDVALADLHKPPAAAQGGERPRHHASAGQRVERHVSAAQLGQLGRKGGVAGAQHVAHAQAVEEGALAGAASCGHHLCAARLDDLHCCQAHAAGGSVHQHTLAWLHGRGLVQSHLNCTGERRIGW